MEHNIYVVIMLLLLLLILLLLIICKGVFMGILTF